MAEFGGALDTWLEAPYVNAAQREAQMERWCESEGVDPAAATGRATHAWALFEDAERLQDEAADVSEEDASRLGC